MRRSLFWSSVVVCAIPTVAVADIVKGLTYRIGLGSQLTTKTRYLLPKPIAPVFGDWIEAIICKANTNSFIFRVVRHSEARFRFLPSTFESGKETQ